MQPLSSRTSARCCAIIPPECRGTSRRRRDESIRRVTDRSIELSSRSSRSPVQLDAAFSPRQLLDHRQLFSRRAYIPKIPKSIPSIAEPVDDDAISPFVYFLVITLPFFGKFATEDLEDPFPIETSVKRGIDDISYSPIIENNNVGRIDRTTDDRDLRSTGIRSIDRFLASMKLLRDLLSGRFVPRDRARERDLTRTDATIFVPSSLDSPTTRRGGAQRERAGRRT